MAIRILAGKMAINNAIVPHAAALQVEGNKSPAPQSTSATPLIYTGESRRLS